MRAVIKDYLKFRKAGFFRTSIAIFIAIILPSIIILFFNLLKGNEIPAILNIVITIGDIFVAIFVPLLVVGNYSYNKYRLYTTLPIKNDNLFKNLYIEIYLIIILAFCITGIIHFIIFDIYSLFSQLFKMVLVLCLSNLLIPKVATEEFIINSEKQQTNLAISGFLISFIGSLFTAITIIVGPETLGNFLDNLILKIIILLLAIAVGLIAIITLKKSYLNTMYKVRLMK